jgi:hypothetical protein
VADWPATLAVTTDIRMRTHTALLGLAYTFAESGSKMLRLQYTSILRLVVPIGCVMIQSLPRAADCYATTTQCARLGGSIARRLQA